MPQGLRCGGRGLPNSAPVSVPPPTPVSRYVISSLELLVAEDYMIVYLNGATPRRRMPGIGWLKKCYQMIDRRSVRAGLRGAPGSPGRRRGPPPARGGPQRVVGTGRWFGSGRWMGTRRQGGRPQAGRRAAVTARDPPPGKPAVSGEHRGGSTC